MTDHTTDDTADLETPRHWRPSPVWLIPLAAALIGCWLLYDNFSSRGPVVTITMNSAAGITAGSTQLKVHSVSVGHVTQVELSDDYTGAIVTIQMNPDTAKLLGDDAQFWLVKPRIGPQGISGLNTIISGAYLEMQPASRPSGDRHFQLRSSPSPITSTKPGLTVKLVNSGDSSLSVGDPIIYQGQSVGRIENSRFSTANRQTVYTVFIKQPYSKLITTATQFWMRSGLDVHLGSDGIDLQVGSLQSILVGGVTFGQPRDIESGKPVKKGDKFKLYTSRKAAVQDRYKRKLKYVILLDDSVRGLYPGAPVEYRGLRLGTVEKVPFYPEHFSLSGLSGFKIPILIAIQPQRPSLAWIDWSGDKWREMIQKFFAHGMRATIKSSNLLTGTMFINVDFDSKAPAYKPRKIGGYQIFPSEPSQFANIQQQLTELVDKVNDMDFGPFLAQVKQITSTTKDTLEELHKTLRHIDHLLSNPETQKLPAELNDTLQQLQKALGNFQRGAPGSRNLGQTLDHLNQVLDNLAPLVRTLRDHPNALIFGPPKGKDPIPRAN